MSEQSFEENDPRSFRVKTDSGTIYTLAKPDEEGFRNIARFSTDGSSQGTFIMRRIDVEQKKKENDDSRFRGKILCQVMIGAPMILGIGDGQERIISDSVVEIIDTTR